MDGKVIFFDIDGTVCDYGGVIPKSAEKAVQLLRSNGHIPVICTGRAKGHLRDKRLLSMGFEGLIAACGSHVEFDGIMIHEDFLPGKTVRKIIELAKECRIPIVFEGNRKHWISDKGFEHDDFIHRMIEELGNDAVLFDDYIPDIKANKFAGNILFASNYGIFEKGLSGDISFIVHELSKDQQIGQSKFNGEPNRVVGMFEGIIPGTSKACGIKMLCDYLNVDPKDTFAIGDSSNDLEMIEISGTGIAMGNASACLKDAADFITDSVWDDGLYNAMKYYGLI